MTVAEAEANFTEAVAPWCDGRNAVELWAEYEDHGYVVVEDVLDGETVEHHRELLAPHLGIDQRGRNDFEGTYSNRVYALLGKEPGFADLAAHPLALAFAERELGASCLLSALIAINLRPGETVQPWHTDDGHIRVELPHPAFGVSAFWALDDTNAANGATQVLPGSHRWERGPSAGEKSEIGVSPAIIEDGAADPRAHPDAATVELAAGSVMLAKGTLWHRGGANRSDADRLIVTPQYCAGWARPIENMMAATPPGIAAALPPRVRELIGYSIHPPFMGYVDGVHPRKVLEPD